MAEHTLSKGYEPKEVENRWIEYWESEKSFTPDPGDPGEPYSIVIPPPNVTGSLHMGHALNLTLQDILCRHHRQLGRNVLWVPGTDHAGIATQNVVERSLAAEGKKREELGREAFVERVWEWKEEYGNKILNQVRRMGASVDWSRLRFTMDEGLSRAVREVFVRLYDEGLIYRGDYIINWCPRCCTALADLEVEHEEVEGGLYEIAYPLADGSGELVVATTRPETMLGDTAVAIHPEDERYQGLAGCEVQLPLTDRLLPIIADPYVDREFGTGCLKITPAHDMNDFEIGRKHGLPMVQVIDGEGVMTEAAGSPWTGLDRFECRKQVLQALKEQGLLRNKTSYKHNVGHCYRCRTAIEPYVSPQWFVRTKPLAEKARQAVSDQKTLIFPSHWEKTYFEWLDNIRDWCISRQIWWGHRIPAWTCRNCGRLIVAIKDPKHCPSCSSADLVQDEDVLDTWFSSALWPFSTLGWPDKTPELEKYYPTSVLVTGFDILFFWVARMMMMGLHFMDRVPFRHVYIHALVRDQYGQKMSKSKGNVIDPLETIDRFGTDAFRFTLTAFAAMGRDIKMSEDRIEGYRHFINKIWNAARFCLMHVDEADECPEDLKNLALHHRWILHRLNQVTESSAKAVAEYQFNEYAQGLYQFVWHEFCDWYLELIKPELYGDDTQGTACARVCLKSVLENLLVLLHPVIPFVTQEIWSHIPGREKTPDLSRVPYPRTRRRFEDPQAQERMEFFQDMVVTVRNIRSELGINPAQKLDVLIRAEGEDAAFLREHGSAMAAMARLGKVEVMPDLSPPKASASAVVREHEVYVPLAGAVDFDAELERLGRESDKLMTELQRVQAKLGNENFVSRAPRDVVDKEKAKAEAFGAQIETLARLKQRLLSVRGE